MTEVLKLVDYIDVDYVVLDVKGWRGEITCRPISKATSELQKYWINPSLAIGRYVTVQYQGLTNDKMPRFPVGIRFREEA